MHLIPASDPNDVVTVERASAGGRVELRIGRNGSRSLMLTAARRVADALIGQAES
jgi:hypothetical protein